jgi:signal peptidase I
MVRKFGAAVAVMILIVLIVGSVHQGSVALVRTHGNSMYPRITTGDLVIVARGSSYRPGDVVAYHSRDLGEVVLHRVKAVHGNRYTFHGDHNDFDDPEQPDADQLIGREVVHLPGGGVWLDRLAAPQGLALIAFMFVAGGRKTSSNRRDRRRRPMAQHARPWTGPTRLAGLSRSSAVVALLAAVVSLAGLALSGLAWTTPATHQRSSPGDSESRLTFSYSAEVPRSPAYQGTTVRAPNPLFRSLVDIVRLSYSYTGRPGTIRLDAEISSASGWHTRIRLQPTIRFDQTSAHGRVQLDLDEMDGRAAAAAAVIGMPIDQATVVVVATVRSADGETFTPRLTFALTPTELMLASESPQLEFRDSAGPTLEGARANSIEIAGRAVEVSALRVASAGVSALALSVLLWIVLAGRQGAGSDSRLGSLKHRSLLLEVQPIMSPPGRPIVDVADFAALSKLAQRYGVLVMHWTRSGVRTFVVHDDGVTYRYRVDVKPRRPSSPQQAATTAPPAARCSAGTHGESIGQA